MGSSLPSLVNSHLLLVSVNGLMGGSARHGWVQLEVHVDAIYARGKYGIPSRMCTRRRVASSFLRTVTSVVNSLKSASAVKKSSDWSILIRLAMLGWK